MKPDPESVRKALLNARQAIQRGDRQAARSWAEQAVALDPDSEEPWLFLAAVASPRASINYLEQALRINPHSQRAHKGMEWAAERLKREQVEQSSKQETPPLAISFTLVLDRQHHPGCFMEACGIRAQGPASGEENPCENDCPFGFIDRPAFAQVFCRIPLVKKHETVFFSLAELDRGSACRLFYRDRNCRAVDFPK